MYSIPIRAYKYYAGPSSPLFYAQGHFQSQMENNFIYERQNSVQYSDWPRGEAPFCMVSTANDQGRAIYP